MSGQFFNRIFGCNPKKFSTIPDIDEFVKERKGIPVAIEYAHTNLCSNRGSVFSIEDVPNPDKAFDKALSV